ncbi:GTPase activating protein [Trypanosoma conorhini]|uniref:GTPase activating protein n=1 Tax=Trypanosoma conorhini TaxID=83891 RepID=A0A422Q8Y6_9TRYP|nr:GTPase activating protein [Trypanosoma conorhini]RNF26433.1 GTPase activating protein [Trypanosoma conorhini]
MGPIARALALELLEHSTPQQFLLVKDGVTVKCDHDRSGARHVGQIIILRKEEYQAESVENAVADDTEESVPSPSSLFSEETTRDKASSIAKPRGCGEYFLLWVPYSFIDFQAQNAGRLSSSGSAGAKAPAMEALEWRYIMCVAVNNIAKVRRRTQSDGTRTVELCFLDGATGHPLIFMNGGVTRFLDVLRGISPLRQSSVTADDFLVYAADDAETAATDGLGNATATRGGGAGLHSDKRRSSNGRLAGRSPRPNDVENVLYENHERSLLSRLAATVATKIDKVRSQRSLNLAQQRGKGMPTCPTTPSLSHADESLSEERFEFVEEVIPVESQTPRIPAPIDRAMGPPLTAEVWNSCFTGEERRVDRGRYAKALAIAHAGGIEKEIRMEVWCFMLHVYPDLFESTEAQRESVRERYKAMYEQLKQQWESILPEQEANFSAFRGMRAAIEKDVVRTDRSHESYLDADGAKQRMLYNVLMTHGMLNFDLGYCQGMSDVLSPIALLAETEEEAFMCFSRFLTEHCKGNFCKNVKAGMEQQLEELQLLVRVFVPRLYNHLVKQNSEEMQCCFRWRLMLFKREFSIDDIMLLWDVILSCPYTTGFELFVTAALLKALSPQILEQHLTHDELLQFTNSIAGKLDVRHLILLAQDFYDGVAKCALAMERHETAVGNYRPTLKEIISLLRLAEMEDPRAVAECAFE